MTDLTAAQQKRVALARECEELGILVRAWAKFELGHAPVPERLDYHRVADCLIAASAALSGGIR
jgi:hypothetical protein